MGANAYEPTGRAQVNLADFESSKVMRIESNASMIVDDRRSVSAVGNQQFSVFNSQSVIEVGGQLKGTPPEIIRPFKGTLLGLKFNNVQILEQARLANKSNSKNVI